jgi:hypothetical protein
VRQKWVFATCFPLNVSMVYSPILTFVANSNNPTGVEFTPIETICYGSLKFTTEGEDSCIIFVGMVHNGSPSLHTVLEESSDKGDTTSGGGGTSGFPSPRGCNVVTPTVPIATTPLPKKHSVASNDPDDPAADRHTTTRHRFC